jgi:hypothetical protein
MRTAASRTSRSLVPRDQSNRSGLQGTRSALSVTAQRGGCGLHLRSCTDVAYPHVAYPRGACPHGTCSVGDAGDGYNTLYLTKRTHPWRIRTRGSCYSRLLREANSVYAGSSTLGERVWGGRHWPETCICVQRSGEANSLVSEPGFADRAALAPGQLAAPQEGGITVGQLAAPAWAGGRGRPTHRLGRGRGRGRPTHPLGIG